MYLGGKFNIYFKKKQLMFSEEKSLGSKPSNSKLSLSEYRNTFISHSALLPGHISYTI